MAWSDVSADRAVNGEQHADEREHEADWPANIESHKFSFFRLGYWFTRK